VANAFYAVKQNVFLDYRLATVYAIPALRAIHDDEPIASHKGPLGFAPWVQILLLALYLFNENFNILLQGFSGRSLTGRSFKDLSAYCHIVDLRDYFCIF
jgi:hypothetical protein